MIRVWVIECLVWNIALRKRGPQRTWHLPVEFLEILAPSRTTASEGDGTGAGSLPDEYERATGVCTRRVGGNSCFALVLAARPPHGFDLFLLFTASQVIPFTGVQVQLLT